MPSIFGHPVLRREDPRFFTGQGAYAANVITPFGVRHLDMPLSPQRVWAAVESHV